MLKEIFNKSIKRTRKNNPIISKFEFIDELKQEIADSLENNMINAKENNKLKTLFNGYPVDFTILYKCLK